MKKAILFIILSLGLLFYYFSKYIFIAKENYQIQADTISIKKNMDSIVSTNKFRNYQNLESLNQVSNFIKSKFIEISDSVSEQRYTVDGNDYKNVICSINTDKKERIIIGAHYDVCGESDGADDNASGIVGLIELAKLLKNSDINYRIDFVAYTLEEPPYYATENMGSYIHAKYLFENKIKVKGMICLEMLGYYNDKENSQEYPIGFLKWIYGNKGDFITVVQRFFNGDFGDLVLDKMQEISLLPTRSFKGPTSIPGVDFSDHRNYWKFGYSSVMVSNSAFYRNKNYHESTDKIETIDFRRLALVVDELYLTIKDIK